MRGGYAFVIIGLVIVIVGSVMMIYVIPPMQYRLETGFITNEEAKNIAHELEWRSTQFVFLKYIIPKNGGCSVMMTSSDPYSKKTIGNGQEILLPCFPHNFYNKTEGFAWTVDSSTQKSCPSLEFVDAKSGEFIGTWGGGGCVEYHS